MMQRDDGWRGRHGVTNATPAWCGVQQILGRRRHIRANRLRASLALSGERLEARQVLTGIDLHGFTADGASQLYLTYEITAPVEAFDLAVYRSSDGHFDPQDTLLDRWQTGEPSEISDGIHAKTLPLGQPDGLQLPGAGTAETDDDYYILAVARPTTLAAGRPAEPAANSPISDVVVFAGIYHPAGQGVFVHGRDTHDSVHIDGSHDVTWNGRVRAFDLTDVTDFRIRLHAGDDQFDGESSLRRVVVHGGSGADRLRGGAGIDSLRGGADRDELDGGANIDLLDGGEDADQYTYRGEHSAADDVRDSGQHGIDALVAQAPMTTIPLGSSFSFVETGIEQIDGNQLADVRLTASQGRSAIDLAGILVRDIARLDGLQGKDEIIGSDAADVFRGGPGADLIDGGDSEDTALYDGLLDSYLLSRQGDRLIVRDLQPQVDGNDGSDTLTSVEVLRFRDREIRVTQITTSPPEARNDIVQITEDAPPTTFPVLNNDWDPDPGDTKRIVSLDTTGLRGTATISADGTSIRYVVGDHFQHLVTGATASETLKYTVADGSGNRSTATVQIAIQGLTDGLRARPDSALAIEDGGVVHIPVLNNDSNDTDPSGALTLVSVDGQGSPATIEMILIYGVGVGWINPGFPATQGSVSLSTDGQSIVYQPYQGLRAGESTTDLFRYTIRDAQGRHSTAIGSITVMGANDPPQTQPDRFTIEPHDSHYTFSILSNDRDPDVGDQLRVTSIDANHQWGRVAISGDGRSLVFQPDVQLDELPYGETRREIVRYTVQDSAGATEVGEAEIVVRGRNHAPIAVADAFQTHEDAAPLSLDVLINDHDPDLSAGDQLLLASVNQQQVAGEITLSADQRSLVYSAGDSFQYLAAGQQATETIRYTITDQRGEMATGDARITIAGRNDAPQAAADRWSISEDTPLSVLTVLTNDQDIDVADELSISEITATGLRGTLQISADGQSLEYVPSAEFQSLQTGQTTIETFTYTIADPHGLRSTATVSLTIVGQNEPVVYVQPPTPQPGNRVGTSGDDTLNGTAAVDVVFGQQGEDELFGYGGDDRLYGGADRDRLDGGAGDDVLHGGSGRDDLEGADGADRFLFYLVTDSTPANFDRVRDFDRSDGDRIDLEPIDANTVVGGNNAFHWVTQFSQTPGELLATVASTNLYWVRGDVNGDGIADLQIEVRSESPLTAADFIL